MKKKPTSKKTETLKIRIPAIKKGEVLRGEIKKAKKSDTTAVRYVYVQAVTGDGRCSKPVFAGKITPGDAQVMASVFDR